MSRDILHTPGVGARKSDLADFEAAGQEILRVIKQIKADGGSYSWDSILRHLRKLKLVSRVKKPGTLKNYFWTWLADYEAQHGQQLDRRQPTTAPVKPAPPPNPVPPPPPPRPTAPAAKPVVKAPEPKAAPVPAPADEEPTAPLEDPVAAYEAKRAQAMTTTADVPGGKRPRLGNLM